MKIHLNDSYKLIELSR